jgi:hypothetical protein
VLRRFRFSTQTFEKPARRAAKRRLRLEALERRELLTAAPVDPNAEISLLRHGQVVEVFEPASETDVARGDALREALAEAQPSDEIVLGAFTFDMGSTAHVEFPARVTVTGAGKEATRITSACPQSVDGAATYTLNNETTIQDLWLEGSLLNGLYQPLVGMQGATVENTTTYLRRVKITGDSDGIFIWTGTQYTYTLYGYDCDITTHYDAIAVLGSGANPQTVKLYNSTITVGQPDPIPAHTSNGVNARSGMVGLYNCTVTAIGDASSFQTTGVWTWNHGSAEVVNTTFNVSSPAGRTYDFFIQDNTPIKVVGGQGSGPGDTYVSSSHSEQYLAPAAASVVGRNLFYNNSAFDDYQPRPGGHDDAAAFATDKTPLLPNGKATFANVTSYSKGINGIAIDLSGWHGSISADDFVFKVGNNNAPSTWARAPAPTSVTVFGKTGALGSDRVEIVWNDGVIAKRWLSITMLANADTGLATPSTFYFGSAVADSGLSDTATLAIVNASDELLVRNNPASNVSISSALDYNRDGAVDQMDELTARANYSTVVTALKVLDLSLSPLAPAGDNASVVASSLFMNSPEPALLSPSRRGAEAISSASVPWTGALLSPTAVNAAWKTLEPFWLADDQAGADLGANDADVLGEWFA